MNRVKQIAEIALLVFLAVLGWKLFVSARTLVKDTDATVKQIQTDAHGTSQNLNALLIQLGLTGDQVRLASIEQRAYWRTTSKETADAVGAVNTFVAETNANVNQNLIPSMTQTSKTVGLNVDALGTVSVDALNQISTAGIILQRKLDKPEIDQAISALAVSSQNLSNATQSLANTTKDIETKVHQMTRPASFAKRVGLTILDLGSKMGSLVGGLVK